MKKNHDHTFSVAPMVDYTDAHCRFFHRLMTSRAYLYTEMITTNAILHGSPSLLHHPYDTGLVALQLGGHKPSDLARCAVIAEKEGYSSVNLNCGCPSSRVSGGGFGVELMRDPPKVADCLKAMKDAVSIDVTIKQRLGIDYTFQYSLVRDFVGCLTDVGVTVFIVHARNAILEKKITPRMNLSALVLRYDFVYRLKKDFPDLTIVMNGHIKDFQECKAHLSILDGVMLGRAILNSPWILSQVDVLYDDIENSHPVLDRESVAQAFMDYACRCEKETGTPAYRLMKYMINLMSGKKNARAWRRTISDLRDNEGLKQVVALLNKND